MRIRYSKKMIENVSKAYAETIREAKKRGDQCGDEIPQGTFLCVHIVPTRTYRWPCCYCPYWDWSVDCTGMRSVERWTADWIKFLSSTKRTVRTSTSLAESILRQAMIAESEEVLQWLEENMPYPICKGFAGITGGEQ